jgi:peroxiredoxin
VTHPQPLQSGSSVPHFSVRSVDGAVVDYSTIWQRRNVVLVTLPPVGPVEPYVSDLMAQRPAFAGHEGAVVITRDHVPGLPAPGLLVADRWGEIVHILTPQAVGELPSADELLQWLEAIEHRCPECEGEAR